MRSELGTIEAGGTPAGPSSLPYPVLTAWDLKQYAYCPRVLFYALCMPVKKYLPPRVRIGTEVHALVERLERRRSARRFGFRSAAKQFEVRCASDRLGLSGTVDMVLEIGGGIAPVEFKMSRRGLQPNVRAQLAAYAVMLEETFGKPARRGFLVEIPEMRVHPCDVTDRDLAALEDRLSAIRAMLAAERLPEPTSDRGKCPDCELLAYCGDVG